MLTYQPGYRSRKDLNNFYQDICEQPFRADGTTPGILQPLLKQGEFGGLGKVPIFESTFLQVTNRGEFINIHNHPNIITVGILASSPRMLLPNLLVIAQVKKDQEDREMEIKRMIPLEMVDIFVHNLSKRRLKIQMITGRKYYLQLCAPEEEEGFLFERWIRLIYLLRTTRGTVRTSVTTMDPTLRKIWKSANIPKQKHLGSKKDHMLVPTKIKDSVELIRQQHSQDSPSKKKQKKTLISSASDEKILRSGLVQYASLGSLGLSASEEYVSADKHKVSFSKGPPEPISRIATRPPTYGLGTQTGPSKARRSSLSKSSKFKQPSAQFILQPNSSDISPEYSTLLTNAEPSVPFTFSRTASLSKQDRLMSARKHTQIREGGSRLFSKAEGNTRTSLESYPPIIKLQRSQKSRSLVQTPAVLPPEEGQSHSEKKHATESQVKRPSSRGGRETSPSQNFSRKQSQPESKSPTTRTSAAGTAARNHSSVSVDSFGQSEASWLTSAKPKVSEKSASTTLGSHPGKKASRASSRKNKISDTNAVSSEPVSKEVPADTGDRPASRELSQRSKPSRTQTSGVKSQKPRKATSRRSQTSSSPSPERGYSTSRSPDRKKSPGSQLHRTDESASLALSQTIWKTGAVKPSEMVRTDQTGQESQELRPDKQKEWETRSSREKSGKQYQPSSSKWQQESSRSQVNEPKKKLRSALSSAKQRSSLTFVTIYSALSSSLEKIKGSKSKEDTKPHPQEKTPQVSSKPSKRVTISGVIGPSGKDFGQEVAENLTTTDTERMNEDSRVAATMGTEVSSPSQFHEPKAAGPLEAGALEPFNEVHADSSKGGHISSAAEPSSPDSEITIREPSMGRSMIPQKPSRGRTGQSSSRDKKSHIRTKKTPRSKLPSSKQSEKSPSTRVASKKRKVTTMPPKSKKVTTTGFSVDAVDTGGWNRIREQEEPSAHPQKKTRRDEHRRPSSHPSSGPTKPISSVSRKASRRSKIRGVKNALAARSQQPNQTSHGERTSPGPAGHLSEEKTRKSKTSKKFYVPQDDGHHRIQNESAVMEDLHMSKVIGSGQPKSSSKTGPRLQDSRLFRPGGWLEYVERGDEKSTDNRPSSPKSKMAAPSKSHVAIHASGDSVVRSAL